MDGNASGKKSINRNSPVIVEERYRLNESTFLTPKNYRVSSEEILRKGGASRIKANIKAVRLVKKLMKSGSSATESEKKILTGFTGWGSYAQEVFHKEYDCIASYEKNGGTIPQYIFRGAPEKKAAYEKWKKNYGLVLHPALDGLLTEAEWRSAKASTLSGFYTDPIVISAMWTMAERLGFKGGKVVDPAAGTGLFFGLMPEHLLHETELAGIELDSITGVILQRLYPDADIQIIGFENAKRMDDNSADLVISNVPFGNYAVHDGNHPGYSGQSIHNYFLSRSLDVVRPGGIVLVLSSRYTLDAQGNRKILEKWAEKGDFIGAVRLPATAFKRMSNTEVVADILIFRKKSETFLHHIKSFRYLSQIALDNEGRESVYVNEYFKAHPEMVLGEHSLSGRMYGNTGSYTVIPCKTETLEEGLKRVTQLLPHTIMGDTPVIPFQQKTVDRIAEYSSREGALVLKENKPFYIENGWLSEPDWADNPKKIQQAVAYVRLKEALSKLITAMNSSESDNAVAALRQHLNTVYDEYIAKYGEITQSRNNTWLQEDLEYPNAAALETPICVDEQIRQNASHQGEIRSTVKKSIAKADIFFTRTIFPFVAPTRADNVQDAVKISQVYRARIDLHFIADLTCQPVETVKTELLKAGTIFIDPENNLSVARDIYLSGNVRQKLYIAQEAAHRDPQFEHNVTKLLNVQPSFLPIDQISVKLGSSWLPPEVVKAFLASMGLTESTVTKARIDGENGVTLWQVVCWHIPPEARDKWGAEGFDITHLVEDSLNLRRTQIYDIISVPGGIKRVENKEATLVAQEKQRELQEVFKRFVKNDEAVSQRVEQVYNDTFNGHVLRTFDVPDIDYFPGASRIVQLRPNQKVAVIRALQESTLLAHGVGTGKTYELITIAMEMRRLGTAKKPWIVVQGATLSQFALSFKILYPGAKILVPSEKQRTASNRRKLLMQIATGDWDAVITPHSFFNSVSISPDRARGFIAEQVGEYEEKMYAPPHRGFTVKQIQKRIKQLQAHLGKMVCIKKDDNIYFEDLGVDALLIDEAHAYKRGSFYTKMGSVKGLDRDSSQRSMQLLLKARYIQERTGGKNVILATGTPLSNTLAELWTMLRYIRPDLLEEFNVTQFDDFVSVFTDTSIALEETATGDYKMIERFNSYTNGPELLTLWRMAADVALAEDMEYFTDLPKLKNGKYEEVIIERSDEIAKYIKKLKAMRAKWDKEAGDYKKAHPSLPLEMYNKAKRASIDLRLIDSSLPDIQQSKVNVCVDKVFALWNENAETKATQIIFCDSFQSSDQKFNLFHDIRSKLIAKNIPELEIAIIHDFQDDKSRLQLFDKVNKGKVRIVMGTTERLGVGVNIQERLLAVHHLDAPLRPMDFEQRNGRMLRSGNRFNEVQGFIYGIKNTLDSVQYQQLISKQKFINQMLRGKILDRTFENPFDEVQSTFEELFAAFSGNPLVQEKIQLHVILRQYESLRNAYESRLALMRAKIREEKRAIISSEKCMKTAEAAKLHIQHFYPDGVVPHKSKLRFELKEWLEQAKRQILSQLEMFHSIFHWNMSDKHKCNMSVAMKMTGNLNVEIHAYGDIYEHENKIYSEVHTKFLLTGPHAISFHSDFTGIGLFSRLENYFMDILNKPDQIRSQIEKYKISIASMENEIQKPFSQESHYKAALERMHLVETELAAIINEDKDLNTSS